VHEFALPAQDGVGGPASGSVVTNAPTQSTNAATSVFIAAGKGMINDLWYEFAIRSFVIFTPGRAHLPHSFLTASVG
jgi:hypothetical protein